MTRFADEPLGFNPGERFEYSNSNYTVLAAIIEAVTGQKLAEVLRERVLEPLGLRNTGIDDPQTLLTHRAMGYVQSGLGFRNAEHIDLSVAAGAGSMYSTTGDLMRFTRAVVRGALLNSASLGEVFVDSDAIGELGYGLGWFLYGGSAQYLAHGGNIEGFDAHIAYYPKPDVFVAVLCNQQGHNAEFLQFNLATRMRGVNPKLPSFPRAIPLTPALTLGLAGAYRFNPGPLIRITVQAASLLCEVNHDSFDLFPCATDHFFVPGEDVGFTFQRDEHGEIISITEIQGEQEFVGVKIR